MLEHGAYTLLLDHYYATQKPISDSLCERIAHATSSAEKKAVRSVLDQFFTKLNGLWFSTKCEEIIAESFSKSQKASDAAKAMWEAKEAMRTHSERIANAMLATSHKPITTNKQDQKTAPKGDLLDGIDPEIAADFKALRLKIRAPITATAMKGIQREADKANISLQDALRVCCENSWRGFKADWYTNLNGKSNGTSQRKESTAERSERLCDEQLARIEEAERRGDASLLEAHVSDLRA